MAANHYNVLGKFLWRPPTLRKSAASEGLEQRRPGRPRPSDAPGLRRAPPYGAPPWVRNTLQTTALVHEAYLRLVDAKGLACKDRTHFFALSTQIMRILVDAARARIATKRGGDAPALDHSEAII